MLIRWEPLRAREARHLTSSDEVHPRCSRCHLDKPDAFRVVAPFPHLSCSWTPTSMLAGSPVEQLWKFVKISLDWQA